MTKSNLSELIQTKPNEIETELVEIKAEIDRIISNFQTQVNQSSKPRDRLSAMTYVRRLKVFKAQLQGLSLKKQRKILSAINSTKNNKAQKPEDLSARIGKAMQELEQEKKAKEDLLAEINAIFPSNGQPFGLRPKSKELCQTAVLAVSKLWI